MLESILSLTIFGSFTWFAIITTIYIVLLFISEVQEDGTSAFYATLVVCGLFYFWGSFEFLQVFQWSTVGIYLGIGFIYSLIKTFVFSRKEHKKFLESPDYYRKSEIKDHIFRWWTLWPFSLLIWIFGELLRDVFDIVYDRIKGLYSYITKLAEKSVENSVKEKSKN